MIHRWGVQPIEPGELQVAWCTTGIACIRLLGGGLVRGGGRMWWQTGVGVPNISTKGHWKVSTAIFTPLAATMEFIAGRQQLIAE